MDLLESVGEISRNFVSPVLIMLIVEEGAPDHICDRQVVRVISLKQFARMPNRMVFHAFS